MWGGRFLTGSLSARAQRRHGKYLNRKVLGFPWKRQFFVFNSSLDHSGTKSGPFL